ncbi:MULTISPECIES: aminodeoxychorismate/anthranilate synthase component II [unclassified Lentimicrobium]|uniref:anthranilate synthase component II n=1 Tax=unclassified Lentimicrobium TaxID=2677434 RepID=UPI0015582409|nr:MULTISPECIES: aminodeoxychorismate/anthranilate synthase component II [unclassified Lentimicrobium]NPD46928.1 aminodeoxychorismate/anthranilate synthase component II [Lentimicrobium sp. S6]NPD84132.1 aminodeoxychorismate/anthranilate synthase component II [Lentimicrobium sp. L6]
MHDRSIYFLILQINKCSVKKLLILDNYDSFTYNLVQLVEQHQGWDFDVIKNDKIKLEEVLDYDKILLSPGPGLPSDAGIMPQLIKEYAAYKSILGVCLGHHAIAETFGGSLFNFDQPIHGIKRKVDLLIEDGIFENIPKIFEVGLYHSWAVNKNDFPEDLELVALSEKGVIMALRHKTYDVKGVQFHPESIMTPLGKEMLWNWLNQ